MKKLFLLLIALIFITSCSLDDDNNKLKFHFEFVPVVSVDVPQTMTPGQTYTIKVWYNKPNDCHYFDGFYYEPAGNVRTVAVQTLVIEDANCAPLTDAAPEEASFEFLCTAPSIGMGGESSYTFKFYQGDDTAGTQQYLERVVPVVQ
jgi:hypothetical protein